jgi:death on curing protein
MIEPLWLDIDEIRSIQSEIIERSGGTTGILNRGILESTLDQPKNHFYYSDETTSLYKLAATYAYGFVKNHCFVDGNKRIALIATYTFLGLNGIELIASQEDAVDFFLELAASFDSQDKSLAKITKWLENNSEVLSELE